MVVGTRRCGFPGETNAAVRIWRTSTAALPVRQSGPDAMMSGGAGSTRIHQKQMVECATPENPNNLIPKARCLRAVMLGRQNLTVLNYHIVRVTGAEASGPSALHVSQLFWS
jgi:hypothetical protein